VTRTESSKYAETPAGSLERAIAIATAAHEGQVDKAGDRYIEHPLRVMANLTGTSAQVVAVLHDVVEDTTVSFDKLREEGFSEEVIEAVDALTKREGETLEQSMARVRAIPLAVEVKRADIADNSVA